MALPKLSAAQRAEALEKAKAVRKERSELMAHLKAGTMPLTDLLARQDAAVGKIRVRRVLESLPGIGPVRAGQLLADLGISESRRVQGLGANQRARLLELFPPQR
ncbi:integration host factor, actinobacterial type [Streptomyces sp. H10-C2]|uniref:integration host factor, actinobacterial type n=1 Tax=unclassified Streptomyces TaxID=2593676 RepID=UPI0024B9AF2A|nr:MULTISPECIES: integration host factor, actinobacterial type [unclassified Streptomyces]MDJ0346708.1 integration host factor, actinobacterial type [Streptomyces sp. PH10-H1]MDJ0374616.1 integration host factor, actinobacterial type [Streptomyces sp. H10-C2]